MKYKRNITYVSKTDGRIVPPPMDKERLDEIERFDSKFEALVFQRLLGVFPHGCYRICRQERVSLRPANRWVKPQVPPVWKCDFSIYIKSEVEYPFPELLIEAKGQVSRDFRLLLSLISNSDIERLIIIVPDGKALKRLKSVAPNAVPKVILFDDISDINSDIFLQA